MSPRYRPTALQRRILTSLLHLITVEQRRLLAAGSAFAPVITVSDVYSDLASDKGRPPPNQREIAGELGIIPGVVKVKPSIEIADAVWSMMDTLPPPRVASEPAPPPPPPPPFYAHPRLPGESAVQLLHRLLGHHPEGLTVRQMRVLSGSDLASAASTEKTAKRVGWSQPEPRGAIVYKALPQCEATSGAFRCGLGAGHAGSHVATAYDPNTGPEPVIWDDTDAPIPEHVWVVEPENADDVRTDVAPTLDASPDVGPATAEGGDTSAVVEVVRVEHVYGLHSDDDVGSWLGEPTGVVDAPEELPAAAAETSESFRPLDEDREPCPPIKVYVATSLDHAHRAVAVHEALERAGHIITYKWTAHGSVQGEGVARLREVAAAELQGVREADVLVAILPGGRGTHAEIGIAIGLGIPVVLLEQVGAYDADCAFYHAPGVHRWMWAEESVLPLLSMWAEHVWRASVGPNAPKSLPYQLLLAENEIADLEHALDEVRATCVGAGIPAETTDEATGTTTSWPTATLVRRLAEREAMHVDARIEAESAARTHLDEVERLRAQIKEMDRAVDEHSKKCHKEEERLLARIAELEADFDAAHAILNDTFGRSLKKREDESALVGLARTAVEADVAVDAHAAEQRARLAKALGLDADPEWTWSHFVEAIQHIREDAAVRACEEVMAALKLRTVRRNDLSQMPPHERWDALMETLAERRPVLDVIREARAAIAERRAVEINHLDAALELLGAA